MQPFPASLDLLSPSRPPYAPCGSRPALRRPCRSFRRRHCLTFRRNSISRRRRRRILPLKSMHRTSSRCPKLRSHQPCRLDRLFEIRSHRHLLPIRTLVDSRSRPYHRHEGGLYRRRSRHRCFLDTLVSPSRVGHRMDKEQVSRRLQSPLRQCDTNLAIPTHRRPLGHRLRSVLPGRSQIRASRRRRNPSWPLCLVLLCPTRMSSLRRVLLIAPPIAPRLYPLRRLHPPPQHRFEKRRDEPPSRLGRVIRLLQLVQVPPRVREPPSYRASQGNATGSRPCRSGALGLSRPRHGRFRLRGLNWRDRMSWRAKEETGDRCTASSTPSLR